MADQENTPGRVMPPGEIVSVGQSYHNERTTAEVNRTPLSRLTPNAFQFSTPTRSRTPVRSMLSPGLQFLNPNDDEEERARVRAEKVKAQRRPTGLEADESVQLQADGILSEHALKNLLQNCLKLSAANKINQGNTWDLKLIDHLSDLVKNDTQDLGHTNFQMASCTLETGVKIYSYRVDSVHSEAYKLMGGLSRTAPENLEIEASTTTDDEQGKETYVKSSAPKKATGKTLESSVEALNALKLDVAFNLDPLFHQASSQVDEGGARGLLLNNLSVYRGCEVVFDSHEVPEKAMKLGLADFAREDHNNFVNLSFMKDYLHQMLAVLSTEFDITPSLREISRLFEDPGRAEDETGEGHLSDGSTEFSSSLNQASCFDNFDGAAMVDDPGEIDERVEELCANEGFEFQSAFTESLEQDTSGTEVVAPMDEVPQGDEFGDLGWLTVGDASLGTANDWAGPGHWKYAKPKSMDHSTDTDKQKKQRKRRGFNIDFTDLPILDQSQFERRKNSRNATVSQSCTQASLLLLPEDHLLETSSIMPFFLRPSQLCARKRTNQSGSVRNRSHENGVENQQADPVINEDARDDCCVEGTSDWTESEMDNTCDMITPPRKVGKIDLKYDRQSKQVDVRVLKQILWSQVECGCSAEAELDRSGYSMISERGLSFQKVIRDIPEDYPAAVPEDVSVHLCFICLLHLANEQNLVLLGCPTMDDLYVYKGAIAAD